MVVDAGGVLVGVLTDGDIRRAMLRGQTPDEAVRLAMRTDFVSLRVEADTAEINHALSDRIAFVPLVDSAGRPGDFASHVRHRRFPVAEPLLDGNEAEYLLECVPAPVGSPRRDPLCAPSSARSRTSTTCRSQWR